MSSKLYILVSKRLSKSQKACQAVHAAAGWMLDNPECTWRNRTVVILAVEDVEEWSEELGLEGVPHYLFREPYWNDLATALASPYIGEKVRDLPLI